MDGMLAELTPFQEKTTLIMRSGIQFMDFGLAVEPRKEEPGRFMRAASNLSLRRLSYDANRNRYCDPSDPTNGVTPKEEVDMAETLRLFDGIWLPVPFLRDGSSGGFYLGPTTWSRARIISLGDTPDADGHSFRLCLAFDTKLLEEGNTHYLAPTLADVESGETFALAGPEVSIEWFLELPWVDNWLKEIFSEQAKPRLKLDHEEIAAQNRRLIYQGHYLNLLALLKQKASIPEIKLLPQATHRAQQGTSQPIGVDLVLDIGNSRTCGILIEKHPHESNDLMKRCELVLRDLSQPEHTYRDPFESCLEFSQAIFGKDHIAAEAGRGDAFVWPTIARIGPEAFRLSSRRRGTEGSTGISSPKRYLWDESRYEPGWRFNGAYDQSEIEPNATASPFCSLINETGGPLFDASQEDQLPVFDPHYTRSSLMGFMLAEILAQALMQINSAAQRQKQRYTNNPRHLDSITLTVPPSMPRPERVIFRQRMEHAVGLVWKALGWHPEDAPLDGEGAELATPPFPRIHIVWDEATSSQIVYLYSESQNAFAGRTGEFFRATARRGGKGAAVDTITIATIDIGGGTTDLVINDYTLEDSQNINTYIKPEQRFRDGFKVAGDDIVLGVIREVIVPALAQALRQGGVVAPDPLLSNLIGSEPVSVQDQVHRQNLTLQIFYPLALKLLKTYEQFDPAVPTVADSFPIEKLLDIGAECESALRYMNRKIAEALPRGGEVFDVRNVPVPCDMAKLHALFMGDRMEITKTLKSLCEIVYLYQPDILLLTGRPSRLPGIQHLIRALLPVAPSRIVPLYHYHCGTWYPFHKQGRIEDPKTTAAVGAMLCVLGQGRIPGFNLRANDLRAYSTVRIVGQMDKNCIIKEEDVFYRDIDLDSDAYELPEEVSFEIKGKTPLGFRQMNAPRWGASPLYELDVSKEALGKLYSASGEAQNLVVRLKKSRRGGKGQNDSQRFEIAGCDGPSGIGAHPVTLTLKTLNSFGISGDSYWLDSGSVL